MNNEVINEAEMREAQREYLDFLDDDVSLYITELNQSVLVGDHAAH